MHSWIFVSTQLSTFVDAALWITLIQPSKYLIKKRIAADLGMNEYRVKLAPPEFL